MASHSTCTHPSTPAARAQCRKLRAAGAPAAPLLATAPIMTPTIDLHTKGDHMTQDQARHLARELLDAVGLATWGVRIDNAKRRAGVCRYNVREISFSAHLLALRTYDESLNTISHEVAHALTPGHKHDHVWAAKHRELGGDGLRCYEASEKVAAAAPWVGTCEHGKEFPRYRQPKRLQGWVCKCPAGRTPITWTRNS
ncbi:SprT-like protease [Gordonia phage AikoCarson]|nr:SprT-like protease [Gordonia phage AikoCarson]